MYIKGIYSTSSGGRQFLLLLFFLLVGTLLSLLGGALISLLHSSSPEEGAQTAHTLRLLQGFSSLCTFLFPACAMSYVCSQHPSDYLSLHPVRDPFVWPLTASCMLLLSPLINLLSLWNQSLRLPEVLAPLEQWMLQQEALAEQLTQSLLSSDQIAVLSANLLIIGVIAALTEELFFRGALQRILERCHSNPHVVIWMAAALFSAFHLQFYGFIPRLLLGAYLGYLLHWSHSIWVPIFAHFLNNAVAVITLSSSTLKGNVWLTGAIPEEELLPYACVALCATGLFLWVNRQLRNRLLQ